MKNTLLEKEIIDRIRKVSGRFSPYQVFSDWVEMTALAISNGSTLFHDDLWNEREAMYLNLIRKYRSEERQLMYEMTGLLTEALESEICDVLGEVFMKSEMGSKVTGQFFTPFHLSLLTAKGALEHQIESGSMDIIPINEPSCGGGGMIIAAAKVLHDAGIDYQKKMRVVAQDLDWKGVYMCYVQLSLLGIDAICVQGDTLSKEKTDKRHILRTPRNTGVLL